MKHCPACKKTTFELVFDEYGFDQIWECSNKRCGFNSNCFGCKSGECQEQARKSN